MAQSSSRPLPNIASAASPLWYTLVGASFLFCVLNPFAMAGIALGLPIKSVSATPLGWVLTAGSFLVALTGFIFTERTAYTAGNRRALELSSILALPAGGVALLAGTVLPAIIMWPISAMILITGASGLRACKDLPLPIGVPELSGPHERSSMAEVEPPRSSGKSPSTSMPERTQGEGDRKQRRRRRRRRNRVRRSDWGAPSVNQK